jgi:nickel transport protein
MMRYLFVTLFLSAFTLAPIAAHEVHHTIESGNAVIVQLKYADDKPLSFEAFEATPEGAETPAQVGRTDGEGRAVFVPGAVKRWKFKAYTPDGHGVSLHFDTPTVSATHTENTSESPSRISLLLFGLSLLLGSFGVYQLFLRKKS